MGTTLHGIIEAFIPGDEHRRSHWEDFATVEFNKDYSLQSALSELSPDHERNWLIPQYCRKGHTSFEESTDTEHLRKADVCERGGWASADELESIIRKLGLQSSAQLRGTLEFMRELEQAWPKVRLVYYHM